MKQVLVGQVLVAPLIQWDSSSPTECVVMNCFEMLMNEPVGMEGNQGGEAWKLHQHMPSENGAAAMVTRRFEFV